MFNQTEFQNLILNHKIKEIQQHGNYACTRYYMRFEVDLYTYNGFFVEIWKTLSFGDIYSIDVAPKRSVKDAYLDRIDLKKLGL